MKPLLTREPLPQAQDRVKKQPAQPAKKRKRAEPTKPPFSFPPGDSGVPSGRQDPPLSSPTFSRPPASESSTSSFDEPPAVPSSDHEIRDQSCDPQHGHDAHKRPRIFAGCPSIGQLTPLYPPNPSTDMNDMISTSPDFYDSPVSCTSSSSPAPSDQSPTGATEFSAVQVADYTQQAHTQMYFDSHPYTQPTVAHHDSYGYPIDYSVQYIDPHSDINGYPYPPSRC